jgi:hypothetical protein
LAYWMIRRKALTANANPAESELGSTSVRE